MSGEIGACGGGASSINSGAAAAGLRDEMQHAADMFQGSRHKCCDGDGDPGSCKDQFDEIDRMSEDDLLAPIASRKLAELMLAIPEPCRDPFRSLEDRIRSTVELYRFDSGGKGLIDWAVMQTGLDDPLARFNRHELEEHLKRWSHEREQFLRKLMNEARDASIDINAILDATPNGAAAQLRRFAR